MIGSNSYQMAREREPRWTVGTVRGGLAYFRRLFPSNGKPDILVHRWTFQPCAVVLFLRSFLNFIPSMLWSERIPPRDLKIIHGSHSFQAVATLSLIVCLGVSYGKMGG